MWYVLSNIFQLPECCHYGMPFDYFISDGFMLISLERWPKSICAKHTCICIDYNCGFLVTTGDPFRTYYHRSHPCLVIYQVSCQTAICDSVLGYVKYHNRFIVLVAAACITLPKYTMFPRSNLNIETLMVGTTFALTLGSASFEIKKYHYQGAAT